MKSLKTEYVLNVPLVLSFALSTTITEVRKVGLKYNFTVGNHY